MSVTYPDTVRLSFVLRVGALPLSVVALLPVVGWALGGGLWHWLTPVILFGVGPVADCLLGESTANVPSQLEARYERSWYYRLTLWLYWPVQVGVMLFCYHLIASGGLAPYEVAGLALSCAIVVGLGASVGHELCHHPGRLDRFIGVQVLSLLGMANFLVYHNYGHHNLVATPEDPGSARFGQSFWDFAPRSMWRKFTLGWAIEAQRLRRLGLRPLSVRNLMIWLTAGELAWLAGLTWFFGVVALVLYPLQWLVGRGLLALADYLEHYGLARRKLPGGEYEPPRAAHSWDDAYLVSNLVFTGVDRHADHHEHSGRPFQILRLRPEAPRLPRGYLVMMSVAMVPPLWRRMVDPLALAHFRKGDVVPHARPGTLPPELEQGAYVY